jgi:hypothetical protein
MASTTSPTCRLSAWPKVIAGSLSALICRMARSDSGSLPTILGLVGLAVVECDLDVVGAFDDVIVGQDVAAGADDDAGTEAGIALRLAFRAVAEEVAEDRVVEQRVARLLDFLRRVDVHDRGQGGPRGVAVGAGRRLAVVVGGRRLLEGDDGLPLR